MNLDVTDPNTTLDWSNLSYQPYVEGKRENGKTVRVVPDPSYPNTENFAHDLAGMNASIDDYVTENFDYIVRSSDDNFQEFCAHLYSASKRAKENLGKLCWERLKNTLGFMLASESEERKSLIGRWSHKIGCDFYDLNQLILAAKTREFSPDTSNMTLTAQAELGRNAGESEEEQREVIRERAEQVRKLDPEHTNTTATVREVKALESNGNKQPDLYRMKDLSDESFKMDWVVMGKIKTGETFDEESGAYEPTYEYFPILRLYVDEPKSEELREQHEAYTKMLLRRLGVKIAT